MIIDALCRWPIYGMDFMRHFIQISFSATFSFDYACWRSTVFMCVVKCFFLSFSFRAFESLHFESFCVNRICRVKFDLKRTSKWEKKSNLNVSQIDKTTKTTNICASNSCASWKLIIVSNCRLEKFFNEQNEKKNHIEVCARIYVRSRFYLKLNVNSSRFCQTVSPICLSLLALSEFLRINKTIVHTIFHRLSFASGPNI